MLRSGVLTTGAAIVASVLTASAALADITILAWPGGPEETALRKIVDIQLELVRQRLTTRRIDLDVSDAAKDLLAERGFDPAFGARPLKRVIQRDLGDRLAMELLLERMAGRTGARHELIRPRLVTRSSTGRASG